jgi:hypothetical protein
MNHDIAGDGRADREGAAEGKPWRQDRFSIYGSGGIRTESSQP